MANEDAPAPATLIVADESRFWEEIDLITATECASHEEIDDALRQYLAVTQKYKDEYLQTPYDVARCSYRLLDSTLFTTHKEYVRRQIIACLLQEDDAAELHLIAAILLFDGKQNEATFEEMKEEEAFPRLLQLIEAFEDLDAALHRILLQLFYEMSRIQRIKVQELMLIEDGFIFRLLQIIETLSDDVSDPYHYPVIRVLLVLNEQYMVCAHDPDPAQAHAGVPNRVIAALATHGKQFKTFGENMILLLNRESETSLQLLILKLLYLLFTTPATYEYFYTNDLRVLVDVVIRNLLDLPPTSSALRHTYLRVLHPLLAHTQLSEPENHYKRAELLKVLCLITGTNADGVADIAAVAHFGATDETTKRLGARCVAVAWLRGSLAAAEATSPPTNPDAPPSTYTTPPTPPAARASPTISTTNATSIPTGKRIPPRRPSAPLPTRAHATRAQASTPSPHANPANASGGGSNNSNTRRARSAHRPTPSPPPPRKGSVAQKLAQAARAAAAHSSHPLPPPPLPAADNKHLTIGGNAAATASSLSVAAVATPRAKPGVLTPSLRQEQQEQQRRGRGRTARGEEQAEARGDSDGGYAERHGSAVHGQMAALALSDDEDEGPKGERRVGEMPPAVIGVLTSPFEGARETEEIPQS